MNAKDRLIPALDVASLEEARTLSRRLTPVVSTLKIGLRLFVAHGPAVVEAVKGEGGRIFLDLKLHDIPKTVETAAQSAASLGVDLVTVHASGGAEMVKAAVEGAAGSFKVLAVTLLTSISEETQRALFGGAMTSRDRVVGWAKSAVAAGAAGVVASPLEAALLREALPPGALIVTPGVRGASDPKGDQARTASATEALRAGATHLVVGRPILTASDPARAAEALIKEMEAVTP